MSSSPESKRRGRPAGRPPGTSAVDTRREILDAALEAFAETGFEAMSVRELTRRLGVSHNLVHHHFGSKQDLWREALDHGIGSTAQELSELLGHSVGSPRSREVLREVIEGAIALLTRRPEVARIFADESARPGPRLDYLYEQFLGPLMAILSRFLSESRAYGVRDVDSRIAALFVLSSVSAQFAHSALAEKMGIGSQSRIGYTQSLVDLVLGGLIPFDPDQDPVGAS